MKLLLAVLMMSICSPALAQAPATEAEAHAETLDYYDHLLTTARHVLDIKDGHATEPDKKRVLQAGAALIGRASQYQEVRARDHILARTTQAKRSNFDTYVACVFAGQYLAEYALEFADGRDDRDIYTDFWDSHKECREALALEP